MVETKLERCLFCDSSQIYTRRDGVKICRKCGKVQDEEKEELPLVN